MPIVPPNIITDTDCRFTLSSGPTPNMSTEILDFRGFDSSAILILRGGILRSRGNFPEILSQQILVGRLLVL